MSYLEKKYQIPGTTLFDGEMAQKGYPLNKMCYSLNGQQGRDEFKADEMAYCEKFGLSEAQKIAVRDRDVLGLIEQGGSIYYLAKFVGMLGLNVQDIGAIQTGKTLEEFKQMLVEAGK